MADLESLERMKVDNIMTLVDQFVKSNSVSKFGETGNMLPSGGDKCAPASIREGDEFHD